ncbi:MAG: bifunctional 4-hydroxy-2-oxoglutarate aldolase/2-dehydro-3-deoxy-phosphogluconate aldolase [Eubacteriales bacterium]|nr:bifunctional 4-hydroxy-2-oxoglutarate aldolase/2-dehydro-3-deoxy-phosphogluconate aldolase [Eubacteriales bacterium]MDD3883157.1 bifunctional 4-hydroxy-2-oxoglutarate aldolase/2-dehydro-3-deoxy-phosphogluconate aldolase [Eubacteriales bacterium]MDD4512460.1 bifunctional 4-hydroxy-2-oxoglutarate aldolase/2-dehydro-3-deoxy-phosphogluconate aldolase [Eubacteriales bacterium]
MDMFEKLSLAGLVPVIKVEDAADAVPLCKALCDGGLPVAEITFRSAAAEQAIKNVHAELPQVILGAGTVLNIEQVQRAVDAGATYIVSPGLNPEVVRYCTNHNIPVLPGCANPSDVEVAISLGLQTVKFFPAEALGGLPLIKAMSAPYGMMRFLPTGGISEKNVVEYLSFPKIVACGGSWMVPGDAIAAKDWARITELTKNAVKTMLGFELGHIGINCENAEKAEADAKALCAICGFPIKDGNSSVLVGSAFELMKKVGRGTNGHIAVKTNSIARAKWHLEQQGFEFDESSAAVKNGKMVAIYLKNEIAGFAIHLLQK